MNHKRIFSTLFLLAIFASDAGAAVIVDTGPGYIDNESASGNLIAFEDPCSFGTSGTACGYSVAGAFTLGDDYLISGIESWLSGGGELNFSVYSSDGTNGDGDLNMPGAALYTTLVDVVDQSGSGSVFGGWDGDLNLAWNLSAGDYWFVLEAAQTENAFYGFSAVDDTLNPLSQYAFYNTDNDDWFLDGGGHSLRLYGEVAAVPVPAAVWLFVSGLLGLMGVARNK